VAKKVSITVAPGVGEFKSGEDLWGGGAIACSGAQFTMNVPARDAVVAQLR
jgi:hypothetical protein